MLPVRRRVLLEIHGGLCRLNGMRDGEIVIIERRSRIRIMGMDTITHTGACRCLLLMGKHFSARAAGSWMG